MRRSSPASCSMAASLPALSRYRYSAGSPARKSGLPPGREKLVASPVCRALSKSSRNAGSGGNVGLSVTAKLDYRTGMKVATPVRVSRRKSGCIAGFGGQDAGGAAKPVTPIFGPFLALSSGRLWETGARPIKLERSRAMLERVISDESLRSRR